MRRPVLAAALLISLSACQALPFSQQAVEAPKPAPATAAKPANFEPVAGRWQVGKAANLRAGPSTDFPVVGGINRSSPIGPVEESYRIEMTRSALERSSLHRGWKRDLCGRDFRWWLLRQIELEATEKEFQVRFGWV